MKVREIISVAVTAQSGIFKFKQKPRYLKLVGIEVIPSINDDALAICQVGITVNNQKGQMVNMVVDNRVSAKRRLNRELPVNAVLQPNQYITGYVRDLAAKTPFASYNVQIILTMDKHE